MVADTPHANDSGAPSPTIATESSSAHESCSDSPDLVDGNPAWSRKGATTAAVDVEGFAAAWIDRNPGSARPTWVVLNVLTAGDVATTEAAVREHWGGALCVTGGASRSVAELDAVVADLMTDEPIPLGVGRDVFHGQVQLTVWVATPELQETYDDRYGPGVVELHSLLVPLA